MHEPQKQGEGQIYSGLYATGNIPERFLKRGMDQLGQMAFMTRGMTKFLSIISTRFGKPKTVSTREHRVYELSELARKYTVRQGSTPTGSGTPNQKRPHDTFALSNAEAAECQPEDILFNSKLYAYATGAPVNATQGNATNTAIVGPALGWSTGYVATGVTFSRIFGTDQANNWFVEFEQMQIINIDAPNSAGPGLTWVTVERVFNAPHAKDFGGSLIPSSIVDAGIGNAAGSAGAIIAGDILLRGLPAFREGTGAPNGFHKNPLLDVNFTQQFKYALEKTNESDIEKTYISKDPLEINRMLRDRRATMDVERAYLYSKKGKSMDAQGKVKYTMGGVVESIPKDADHIISYKQPTLSYQGLLDMTNEVFVLGGSEERFLFTGYTLYAELKKAYYQSGFLRYDEEASREFDIPIDSIIGVGGKINIVPLFAMEEAGWSKRGLCLDLSVPAYVPVTHDGWDMVLEKNIQRKGDQIYKEQMIGIKGLERRYLDYQTILDFPI